MSFFQQQTQVVHIDADNSVTVRRLTFGEQQAVISESTAFDIVSQEATFDFARNQAAKLSRAVVSWVGPGFDGRPVTPENIMALAPEVGQKILSAVEALNAGLSDTEQKN